MGTHPIFESDFDCLTETENRKTVKVMIVLMVAEKPSLANSIAFILSNGRMNTRLGKSGACKIHEYEGTYKGERAQFRVTSVCGHVFSIDFEAQYNNWDKTDPAELFVAGTLKDEANPKMRIASHLKHESRDADELVLWLDCDREGENICFEVIQCCRNINKRNIKRAHFSAITDTDIKAAMNNLGEPNELESLCVDARQEIDLRIGCAFTRFQTKFFQGTYGDLDSSCISYGPCQTPTLGFCVTRHDQIAQFKPEKYWRIALQVKSKFGPIQPSGRVVVCLIWAWRICSLTESKSNARRRWMQFNER